MATATGADTLGAGATGVAVTTAAKLPVGMGGGAAMGTGRKENGVGAGSGFAENSSGRATVFVLMMRAGTGLDGNSISRLLAAAVPGSLTFRLFLPGRAATVPPDTASPARRSSSGAPMTAEERAEVPIPAPMGGDTDAVATADVDSNGDGGGGRRWLLGDDG